MPDFTLFTPFLPFAAVSVFHLVCCFCEWQKGRAVSKVLLMPLLLVGYLLATSAPVVLVVAGLVFGFLGDVFLLMPKQQPTFLMGLAAFLVGHLCYIAMFAKRIPAHPPVINLVLLGAGLAVIGITAFVSLKHKLGQMFIPGGLYMVVIITMAFFAITYAVSYPSSFASFAILGGLSFICSDFILSHMVFGNGIPHGNFWVMLTYLLAQTGIVISVIA